MLWSLAVKKKKLCLHQLPNLLLMQQHRQPMLTLLMQQHRQPKLLLLHRQHRQPMLTLLVQQRRQPMPSLPKPMQEYNRTVSSPETG